MTEYRFTAIPVAVDEDTAIITNPNLTPPLIVTLPIETDQRFERSSRLNASPVASNCMLQLPLGAYYVFQVQSVRHQAISTHKVMGAGAFTWRGQQVPYSYPFLVAIPQLSDASLSLEELTDGKGFIVMVDGWELKHPSVPSSGSSEPPYKSG